ncbi:MAG: peptidylprolyl isomerase [Tabrizicola flagellatus]|uniref:peptidylprolyl isomerase n=1 Tax=Tabrizicola flagellatus TaxID=2593021 RepID=UPI00391CDE36
MSRKLILAAALATVTAPAFAQEADGPGPNLVIEIAGQANGTVVIDLLPDVAPKHVEQIVALAKEGAYDNVVFHRVIDGFMAQTGDVQFGKAGGDMSMAGRGGSSKPDIPAEFTDTLSFQRGVVGMARAQDPNSANSQFFITFGDASFLDGQYTIFGKVISGMEVVDAIKRGEGQNGEVSAPADVMVRVTVQD